MLIGNNAALLILCLTICVYVVVKHLTPEWPLIVGVCLLGFSVDTALINIGVLSHPSAAVLPPLWLSVLWLAFATTINHSLRKIIEKKVLFLILVMIGGPLCYQLGVNLTEMTFGVQTRQALLIIAVVWLFTGAILLIMYNTWKNHVLQ